MGWGMRLLFAALALLVAEALFASTYSAIVASGQWPAWLNREYSIAVVLAILLTVAGWLLTRRSDR